MEIPSSEVAAAPAGVRASAGSGGSVSGEAPSNDSAEVVDLAEYALARGRPLPFGWSTLTMPSDARDFVSRYTRLGLHPILLFGVNDDGSCMCGGDHGGNRNSIGKHPVARGWQAKAPDPAGIVRAMRRDWRHNIGLRMGRQPNGWRLIAIDVDGPRSLLAAIESRLGKLPPTLAATTGKGTHLIFRLREGAPMPKNSTRFGDGVDIRAEGGQIVAAPSRHQSGRHYRWLDAREPAVLP